MKFEKFMDSSPYEEVSTSLKQESDLAPNRNSSRRRANSLRHIRAQQLNIIKPIALRPHQTPTNPFTPIHHNTKPNQIAKFKSIDSINNKPADLNFHLIERRCTIPHRPSSLDNTIEATSPHTKTIASNSQPQRPHLNFIKMKLQQFRIGNEGERIFLEKFNSLDLNNNVDSDRQSRKYIFSSNSTLFSSVSSCSIVSYRNELNESDLDLAQIENDLNYWIFRAFIYIYL